MKYILNYDFISKWFTNLDFTYKIKLKFNFNISFSLTKILWNHTVICSECNSIWEKSVFKGI